MFAFPYLGKPLNAADQQQDRRQARLPTGLAAAFAGCEAHSAEQPADDHPQHCRGREASSTTSD